MWVGIGKEYIYHALTLPCSLILFHPLLLGNFCSTYPFHSSRQSLHASAHTACSFSHSTLTFLPRVVTVYRFEMWESTHSSDLNVCGFLPGFSLFFISPPRFGDLFLWWVISWSLSAHALKWTYLPTGIYFFLLKESAVFPNQQFWHGACWFTDSCFHIPCFCPPVSQAPARTLAHF